MQTYEERGSTTPIILKLGTR